MSSTRCGRGFGTSSAPAVLTVLNANVQDVFNEYGVQIMSPHYRFDPAEPVDGSSRPRRPPMLRAGIHPARLPTAHADRA